MKAKTSDNLTEIIGKQKVVNKPEVLDRYSHDNSFAPPNPPRLVVRPRNTGDVQKVVMWANQTKTPLVPVSSGEPRFRGDTVPSAPDAVTEPVYEAPEASTPEPYPAETPPPPEPQVEESPEAPIEPSPAEDSPTGQAIWDFD